MITLASKRYTIAAYGTTLDSRYPSGDGGDPYFFRDPAGTDKYLDPAAGADGTGSLASPWNTLTAAKVQSLTAGQCLWIREGSIAWPDTTGAASGTSVNRITVSGYPAESATLTFTGDGQRLGGGDYWDFRDLTLSAENNGLCLGENYSFTGGVQSNYFRAIDCTGVRTLVTLTDNSGVIFDTGPSVGTSVIRGSYSGPAASNNQSLIWMDYPEDALIIGAVLDGTANPIYFKHTQDLAPTHLAGTIKNCIIRNAGKVDGMVLAANYLTVTNCVFDTCDVNPSDEGGNAVSPGNNWTVTHCTFYNSDFLLDPGTHNGPTVSVNGDNVLTSNVWTGTSRFMDNPYSKQSSLDMGNLSDYSAVTTGSHFYRNGSTLALAAHQAAFPTQEVHGVAGTITFVGGAGGGGSTAAGWALATGSNGENASSTGTDCGVDVSKLLTVN